MTAVDFPPSRPKRLTAALCSLLLAAIFLASGLWKASDLPATAERMVQLLAPPSLSLAGAFLVAGAETLTAVLLLIPSCRRWGAWLAALLLVVFMAYMGIFYHRLLGEDCSCFPWVRRVVGPAFFVGDAVMLLLALPPALWSRRPVSLRLAASAVVGVAVLLAAAYPLSALLRDRAAIPETALVDGQPASLRTGHVLLYFFDPQCTHCEAVARRMAQWDWSQARIIALPTAEPRYAASFLKDTGLRAGLSFETDRLRPIAPFTTAPHAAVLENGRVIGRFNFLQLEEPGFPALLKRSGHIR